MHQDRRSGNPDIELEEKIHEIHKRNKDYGYRRMCGELRNQGHIVNKKKVQRIMQKYNLCYVYVFHESFLLILYLDFLYQIFFANTYMLPLENQQLRECLLI